MIVAELHSRKSKEAFMETIKFYFIFIGGTGEIEYFKTLNM
jgi:hypothetical protein